MEPNKLIEEATASVYSSVSTLPSKADSYLKRAIVYTAIALVSALIRYLESITHETE